MKKLILSTLVAVGLIAGAGAQTQLTGSLTNGLISYWPFNGNFNDVTKNGNNFTNVTNITFTSNRFGIPNAAVYIASQSSSAQTINNIGITGNTLRTISFWITFNPKTYLPPPPNFWDGGVACILGFGDTSGNAERCDIVFTSNPNNTNNPFLYCWGGYADRQGTLDNTIYQGAWQHITYVFNGNILNSYFCVNGIPVTTTQPSGSSYNAYNTLSSPLRLGRLYDSSYPVNAFQGAIISDLIVYNRCLTTNEVYQLYSSQKSALSSNGFLYSISSNAIIIDKYIGSNNVVSVPSSISGLPVTSINENAFANQSSITSIAIPNTVTNLGNSTFSGCSNLVSVTIPDSVVIFGTNVFGNSPNIVLNASSSMIGYFSQNASALGLSGATLTSVNNESTAIGVFDWMKSWLPNDSGFLGAMSTGLQIPTIISALSNSIASLSAQASPTNPAFVSQIAGSTNFGAALSSNSVFILNLSNQIASASNNLGLATKGEVASLVSNAGGLSNSINAVSNALSGAIGTQVSGLSNTLSSSISNQTAGVSNALTSIINAQVAGLSNSFSSALSAQVVAFSNALSASLASQQSSFSASLGDVVTNQLPTITRNFSNSITALSAQLSPTNPDFISAVASNPVFQGTIATNQVLLTAIASQIASNPALANLMPKFPQTLNFTALKAVTLSTNVQTITLKVTSSAKLTNIVFASGNDAVGSVSNNILTIAGSGATTITASSVGNSNYAPATAIQTLVVNQAPQTLKFPSIPTQTYSAFKTVTLGATASSGLSVSYSVANTAVAIVSNNVLLLQGTGSTTVTATQSGNGIYLPVSATQSLIVK